MADFLEDELFFKDSGMDQDSEPRLIEGYLKLLNGRNANGKIMNIPSTLLINNPYLPPFGENLAIGAFEDQKDDSLIWFNYNSLGYHCIFRYYKNVPGFVNGEIQLIKRIEFPLDYTFDNPNPFNFSNDPTNVITGIALVDNKLYWNQPNDKPKMIDAARANITRKRLKFNLLFNRDSFGNNITYTIDIYKSGNNIPIHTFVWLAVSVTTAADAVKAFADAYFASLPTMAQFHIVNYGDYVEIEMSKVGSFYLNITASGGNGQPLITPENFYPDKDITLPVSYPLFTIDLISRIRYTGVKEPATVYKTDTNRPSNLVKGKVFQFRVGYNYFDYSESCLSAISNIASNIMLNTESSQIVNNYIEVDFTDARLSDPSLVSIIKSVDILFREHNTGVWRVADSLKPYEFAGATQQIYRFYNDGNPKAIDPAKAVKPYDSVPRTAKALEMVGDRLFDGAVLEGYDKIPIDATIDVAYSSQSNPDLYTIKWITFIQNVFNLNDSIVAVPTEYQYNQGIYSLTNEPDNLAYGGFAGKNVATPNPDFDFFVRDLINPNKTGPDFSAVRVPLAGWTFYLAGTDLRGTTKQKEAWFDGTNIHNIEKPFYNCSSYTEREDYRSKLFPNDPVNEPLYPCYNPFGLGLNAIDQNGNLIGRSTSEPATKVYQEGEILNVPAGTYILRIASHLITDALLNDGSNNFQRTSTNALLVSGSDMFEQVIVVGPSTSDAKNNVYIGASVIADLVRPEIFNLGGIKSGQQCGYITDHDKTSLDASSTFNELLTDTRIDNSIVTITLSTPLNPGDPIWYIPFLNAYQWSMNKWYSAASYGFRFTRCDHNGYYFYAIWSVYDPTAIDAKTSGQALTLSINKDNYNNAWAPLPFGEGGVVTVWRNTDDAISSDNRTKLEGTVLVGTIGQANVAVVNQWGAWQLTDLNGNYSIITYDRKDFPSTPDGTRDGNILFCSSGLNYIFSFIPALAPYSLVIGTGGGEYDYDTTFILGNKAAVAVIIQQFVSAMKRGWDGQFGLIYLNEPDQKCAVCTIDALQLHILFYTEKDPVTGLQVNTGYPVLSWSIYHRPPDWATKYQWVRQMNQQMETWIQWIANSVEYINDNDDGTTYPLPSSPGATMCKINLDNIAYYTINRHPGAVINFTYTKGDRLRPIRDAKNNVFSQYYEFEILKVVGTDVYIYKDVTITFEKGTLFEIFTPRGDEEIKVFYEFGECYEVKTAVIEGVRQKYHAGPIQDQTYGPVPVQAVTPATGIFKTGDSYYRTREMQIGTVLATDIAPLQASSEGSLLRNIEDPSVSDFYESLDISIGRVNLEYGIREIFRQSTVRFTNRYLSDTETNGLSSNEPLNEKQFSNDFGLLTKLILIGNDVLKAIFSNSWQVNMYINKGLLREASGQTLIAISDDVIPRVNENERTYGSQHPESISITNTGDIFGWDEQIGVYWRSSGNGLVPISEYYMNSYFTQKSNERLKPGYVTKNPAIYDIGKGQVLHTFSDQYTRILRLPKATMRVNDHDAPINILLTAYPSNTVLINAVGVIDLTLSTANLIKKLINAGISSHGFSAVVDVNGHVIVSAPSVNALYSLGTLVLSFGSKSSYTFQFDEGLDILPNQIVKDTIAFTIAQKGTPNNRWPENYSFTPEHYGRIRNDIFGFVNGQLWKHDAGPDFNSFYGIYYPLRIEMIFKKDWQKTKVLKGFSYKSKSLDFYVPSAETPPTADYPTGQETKLSKKNFKATQAGVYAAMNKDMRDTSIADVIRRITNGRPMRGTYIKVVLENDSIDAVELFSAKIIYFYSELS